MVDFVLVVVVVVAGVCLSSIRKRGCVLGDDGYDGCDGCEGCDQRAEATGAGSSSYTVGRSMRPTAALTSPFGSAGFCVTTACLTLELLLLFPLSPESRF